MSETQTIPPRPSVEPFKNCPVWPCFGLQELVSYVEEGKYVWGWVCENNGQHRELVKQED